VQPRWLRYAGGARANADGKKQGCVPFVEFTTGRRHFFPPPAVSCLLRTSLIG
jgi:hypothetical protein